MNTEQMLRYEAEKKSQGIAFVLWWLLGIFGAHRFYLNRKATAIVQLLLAISVVGWVVLIPWLFVDLFLIWGMTSSYNQALITRVKEAGA